MIVELFKFIVTLFIKPTETAIDRNKRIARKIITRHELMNSGNLSLIRGRYITKNDVDQRREHLSHIKF